jgi:threonine synthase
MRTPLLKSGRIASLLGLADLRFKLEDCNPSGSYKDRFIGHQIRYMQSCGVEACVATSSGNTGAALAAGCARAGFECTIIVDEQSPAGKLVQMRAHGARVIRVRDFLKQPEIAAGVYRALDRAAKRRGIPVVVSAYRHCPEGMAGVEAIGRELADLPGLRHVFVPVGSGGLYIAVCAGLAGRDVRVHAVQPKGCLTVVAAWLRGDDEIRPVAGNSRISGLIVPFDIDGTRALRTLRANGGRGYAVTDEEVWEAQRLMLEMEGICSEPAGAAALAGLRQAVDAGHVGADETTVCLVTGHGFKDPDSIESAAARYPDQLMNHQDLEEALR